MSVESTINGETISEPGIAIDFFNHHDAISDVWLSKVRKRYLDFRKAAMID